VAAAGAIGAATLLGVALTEQLDGLRSHGLAISTGVTIYVGASNLVPELQSRSGWATPLSFLAGCGAYFATRALV
jgi:ZIP family zinc transporter/zinc and cadmium transporter